VYTACICPYMYIKRNKNLKNLKKSVLVVLIKTEVQKEMDAQEHSV
jgi:hypothetical protein